MTDAIKLAIKALELCGPAIHKDTSAKGKANYSVLREALAALRAQPAENDEYNQGYIAGSNREAEIWRDRLDAERQRSVHIEAMNRTILEHAANLESIAKPRPMILMAAQPDHSELVKYARLGKVAMRFVDRAGDVHPGIDDAETICAEFYKAMSDALTLESIQ